MVENIKFYLKFEARRVLVKKLFDSQYVLNKVAPWFTAFQAEGHGWNQTRVQTFELIEELN